MNFHHKAFNAKPDATALAVGAASISYARLAQDSAALAGALRAAGVMPGDLVGVCLERSAAQVTALLAAWQAGAAYLPIDPQWPESRQSALLSGAGAAAVVASQPAHGPGAAPPRIDPAARSAPLTAAPTQGDLAYVIYTSGSTGTPKAVEVTHGNLAALIDWHISAFGLRPGTRVAYLAGLAFDAAAWEVWPALAAGATLVIPADETLRYDAARLADWLVAERIEVAFAPTVIAEQLIARAWPPTTALRWLLTGADQLKARPRPGLPFALVNNYGPTENTVVATSAIVAPQGEGLPAIGLPLPGVAVHLLDGAGQEAEEGEIWLGGAQVAHGYRGDPALTAERFPTHPRFGRLYRTGDLARRGADGQLHFLGRADAQLKLRGHRIEPAEIEAALVALGGIAAAAVAVRDGELAAWIVPQGEAALVASDLRAALAQALPAPMVPSHFAAIAALPLNASGKLDRAALPDPAANPLPETHHARPAATPTEERLAAIIAGVIGRADFGMEDDFFLLGGHSLLGTQVIVKAREAFGVELTLLHLFEARTVARLASVIEELALAHLASLSDEEIARMMEG